MKKLVTRAVRPCLAQKVLVLILGIFAGQAARANPSDLCLQAAHQAARESGVPYAVMRTITQIETGRTRNGTLEPWPWTINMQGQGHWFDSREEALAFATRHHAAGARSFDTGCFQINYRWHAENFASLEEMFDPLANARYAAAFLTSLHAETGDWSRAAGFYHSRTVEHATRYRRRFDSVLALAPSAPRP